jgi:hypothetical protein
MDSKYGRIFYWGLAGAIAAFALLVGAPSMAAQTGPVVAPAAAAAPAAIKPVTTFNVLMVKFVDQASDAIWDAATTPPKTACGWEQVEFHATQLATTGTLLRVGGTGPMDARLAAAPQWSVFADRMSEISLAAAKAARQKDAAALQKAGNELVVNCEGCHKAFKPEIPTQNVTTHLSHNKPELSPQIRCRDK